MAEMAQGATVRAVAALGFRKIQHESGDEESTGA